MRFLILLFLILIAIIGYFSQLNPDRIAFFVTPNKAVELSLTALILVSIAVGGMLVMIAVGVRQTRAIYFNWTYRRRVLARFINLKKTFTKRFAFIGRRG
ncbi:MAG: hypothetical protein HY037_07575 [Nitrospirae bacterium]|nr:hypothetical protein [Candidatus Troglogloeales bacterium]